MISRMRRRRCRHQDRAQARLRQEHDAVGRRQNRARPALTALPTRLTRSREADPREVGVELHFREEQIEPGGDIGRVAQANRDELNLNLGPCCSFLDGLDDLHHGSYVVGIAPEKNAGDSLQDIDLHRQARSVDRPVRGPLGKLDFFGDDRLQLFFGLQIAGEVERVRRIDGDYRLIFIANDDGEIGLISRIEENVSHGRVIHDPLFEKIGPSALSTAGAFTATAPWSATAAAWRVPTSSAGSRSSGAYAAARVAAKPAARVAAKVATKAAARVAAKPAAEAARIAAAKAATLGSQGAWSEAARPHGVAEVASLLGAGGLLAGDGVDRRRQDIGIDIANRHDLDDLLIVGRLLVEAFDERHRFR